MGLLCIELGIAARILPFTLTFTVFGLLLTLLVVWGALEYTQRILQRSSVHDHYSFLMAVCIPGTVYLDACGDIFHLYTLIPSYDTWLHFFNPAVGAIWMWHLIYALHPELSQRFRMVITFTITATAGTLYEIEEYLEDVFTGSHRLGDAWDTGLDLTMDLAGPLCALCCLMIYQWMAKRSYRRNA